MEMVGKGRCDLALTFAAFKLIAQNLKSLA